MDPALSARTPGDTERPAVDAAFAAWQSAASGCSDLKLAAGTGGPTQAFVVWRETACAQVVPMTDACHAAGTCETDYRCWDDDAETLALTALTYSRTTGVILHADIRLNGSGWLFTTVDAPPCREGAAAVDCVATDVQNTVTHEIGHLLGLDHVPSRASTMSATAPLGDLAKRVIDPGTAEGLCAIYPRGAPTPQCMP